MARIIYGVAGEGFGHSSRSELIGQRLIDAGHEVKFMASRKSLMYLRQRFGVQVKPIFGLCLVYENGVLNPTRTFARNLKNYSKGVFENLHLFREEFEPFAPDLVISDYEPFSSWWAWRNGVPCVSVDHQHILSHCDLDYELPEWSSRLMADVVTRCYHPQPDAFLMLNFFKAPVRHPDAVLAPPVVRSACEQFMPTQEDHVLVYFTDTGHGTQQRLTETLRGFKQRFVIYGFNRDLQEGNCTFKSHSREGFLRDLSACRGAIATAGFSMISECLYYNKPMLVLPVHKQYEQMTNARYVESLGIGRRARQLDADAVADFLVTLERPRNLSENILYPDNDLFFSQLQRVLNRVRPEIRLEAATPSSSACSG